jgi:hypothetical protein
MWVKVAKDWSDLLPLKRMSCGDECKGWYYDLATKIRRSYGDFKGYRAIAHGNAMLNS